MKRYDTSDDDLLVDEGEETTITGLATQPALPAITSGNARLVDLSGQLVHQLSEAISVLGRSPVATIVLEQKEVSRRHAKIMRLDGRWYFEDLDSRNGSWINGQPAIGRTALEFGDSIQIGSQLTYLFTAHDEVQERILNLQKMEAIGHLAGGIAHDFNNLLAVIGSSVDVLLERSAEGPLDPELLDECLADSKASVTRASELTKQLLGFARSNEPEQGQVDLSAVVSEVLTLCRRTFHPRVTIDVAVDPLLQVMGDQTQLHQVVLNLCINARDAMPDGGTLAVRAGTQRVGPGEVPLLAAGLYAVLEISDDGLGMDPATQRRVFEPFFTTKDRQGGTGLGLATVFRIVASHRGQVSLESAVGEGTSFKVYLPARKRAIAARQEQATVLGSTRPLSFARSVLLVDDDTDVLRSAKRLLGVLGFEVVLAGSGQAAINAYQAHRSQVGTVLLDLVMPGMDGEQTYHQLQRINPDVDVVLISAAADEPTVQRMRQAGVRAFLPKPFNARSLRQALAHHL